MRYGYKRSEFCFLAFVNAPVSRAVKFHSFSALAGCVEREQRVQEKSEPASKIA